MSECVVRMSMPEKCYQCDIRLRCPPFLTKAGQTKPMREGCRIICSLPEGHGRLVDGDELWKTRTGKAWCMPCPVWSEIFNAPTIVPAASKEENQDDGH